MNNQEKAHRWYTDAEKAKAQYYYHLGLTMEEITKLIDGVSVRTLKHWRKSFGWDAHKRREQFKRNLREMKLAGLTLKEISEKTGIAVSTIHRYLKELK